MLHQLRFSKLMRTICCSEQKAVKLSIGKLMMPPVSKSTMLIQSQLLVFPRSLKLSLKVHYCAVNHIKVLQQIHSNYLLLHHSVIKISDFGILWRTHVNLKAILELKQVSKVALNSSWKLTKPKLSQPTRIPSNFTISLTRTKRREKKTNKKSEMRSTKLWKKHSNNTLMRRWAWSWIDQNYLSTSLG